jgi:hypothetical protein
MWETKGHWACQMLLMGKRQLGKLPPATAVIQTTVVSVSFQYYLVAFIHTINIILLLSLLSSFYFSPTHQI